MAALVLRRRNAGIRGTARQYVQGLALSIGHISRLWQQKAFSESVEERCGQREERCRCRCAPSAVRAGAIDSTQRVAVDMTVGMVLRASLSSFIQPCLPSPAERPPSGPGWIHEIKHDGFRMMVRRDAAGVRLLTRNGINWSDRFPLIFEAASALQMRSFLIDGEAVACDGDGVPVSTGCGTAARTGGFSCTPSICSRSTARICTASRLRCASASSASCCVGLLRSA
jgi:ATP-dependent DNA ligase